MFGRHQAGEYLQAASLDREIVKPAAKPDAAHLDHAEPAPLGAVIDRELFEHHHAVRDGMELQIVLR